MLGAPKFPQIGCIGALSFLHSGIPASKGVRLLWRWLYFSQAVTTNSLYKNPHFYGLEAGARK